MEMSELQGPSTHLKSTLLTSHQRQHTANIMEAPKAYLQQSPAKPTNVIVIDCRGLEFTEFKADVRSTATGMQRIDQGRVNGKHEVSSPALLSLGLTLLMASGSITMRKPARRSVSKMSNGRFDELEYETNEAMKGTSEHLLP